MQAVDILRNQHFGASPLPEPGQCPMRAVGLRMPKPPPSNETACPIPAPRVQITHECLEHDRLGALPVTVLITIVGNSGIRAAAGTGEYKQLRMASDELAERIGVGHGGDYMGSFGGSWKGPARMGS